MDGLGIADEIMTDITALVGDHLCVTYQNKTADQINSIFIFKVVSY